MDCPHIPEINLQEFNERFQHERIPIQGVMEITHRCNLNCVHCYCRLPASDLAARRAELTFPQICQIIDEIVDEGCLYFTITGGEPLLRQDFLDIYTYAKKKGLLVSIFTNGTLITPHVADYLQEWQPVQVEISVYGATQETYEKVTGVPGSYERCMVGIQLLLDRGIKLALKTMAMTLNKHEVFEIKRFAEDLGLDFRWDALITPKLDTSKDPYEVRLSPGEVMGLELADEDRVRAMRAYFDRHWNTPLPEALYACGAGVLSFLVDPRGQLAMCALARMPSYDLLAGSFHNGWHHFMPQLRSRPRTVINDKCRECKIAVLCFQCPGRSQLEYGPHGEETPVDYLCQLGHMRLAAYYEQELVSGQGAALSSPQSNSKEGV
jgi:radical SAM protein with 4Fe4S-binding SPASM domain